MHLAQELLMNIQRSDGSRPWRWEARWRPSEVVNDHLSGSKLILLQLHKKLPKSSTSTILQSSGIWSKLERGKSSKRRSHMSWFQKKNCCSEVSSSLSLCNNEAFGTIMNHFLIRLWCVLKSGFYTMTSSVAGPRRRSKALPKAILAPKEGTGHCLVVCCYSDPPQLSKSQQNQYIWEAC